MQVYKSVRQILCRRGSILNKLVVYSIGSNLDWLLARSPIGNPVLLTNQDLSLRLYYIVSIKYQSLVHCFLLVYFYLIMNYRFLSQDGVFYLLLS